VTLPAEIDLDNAGDVADTLLAVLNRGISLLVVDLTGTVFCDCSCVTALIRAYQRGQADGARVLLAGQTPAVRRLLALTSMDRIIGVFDTVPAALAAMAASGCPAARGGRPGTRRRGEADRSELQPR